MYTTYQLHNIYNATKMAIGYDAIENHIRQKFSNFTINILPCGGGIELTAPEDMSDISDPNNLMIGVFSDLIANNIKQITRNINDTVMPITIDQVAALYNNLSYVNQLFMVVGMLNRRFFIVKY